MLLLLLLGVPVTHLRRAAMVSSMSRTRTTTSGMELYSFLVQFVFLKQVHSVVVEYSLNLNEKLLLTLQILRLPLGG